MSIKQSTLIIPIAFVIILVITSGSLTGCVKKTAKTELDSGLSEIHYIPVQLLNDAEEIKMLLSGQADMIPQLENLAEIEKLRDQQNIKLLYSENGSFTLNCVFFNLRRSPTNEQTFREAISLAINRDYIVNSLLNRLAIPCSTFIPPVSNDWTNNEATAPSFDSVKAVKVLDDAGYRFDKNSATRLNPNTNEPIHLNILTPLKEVNSVLWEIGYTLTYYINAIGIKADHIALPDYIFQRQAMQTRDFDILIQDISLAQAPFGLYPLLHSSRDKEWTNAFSGIHDSALDSELERLWSEADLVTAPKAALDVQAMLAQSLPYVSVCSVPVYSAVSGPWDGIINIPGIGASNIWTFQSAHSSDSKKDLVLRLTAPGGFSSLNPLIADSTSEWMVLQQIYSPLFYYDPVNLKDKPVLAKKWDIGDWIKPDGSKGMKVTFYLMDGLAWQDGIPFTSKDFKFCIDFIKEHNVSRYEHIMNLVENVETPDNLTIELYLKESGYRYIYDFNWFTFMPEHIWSDVSDYQTFKPWLEADPNNTELTKLIGQGPYILKPGDLNNGAQLYRK